jgi:DNA polymerase-3 subunit delta
MAKEGIPYQEIRRLLRRKVISSVYFFHGDEDFLIDELTKELIGVAIGSEGKEFNLDIVYGSEADARDVLSHASSFPMMSDRRVVVVRELDKLFNKELLSSYIERPSPTTCLVLHSAKPDFRRKPYVTAKEHAVVCKCTPLKENEVETWIIDRVREQKKRIDPEAARLLTTYTGTSLREVQNELDKLSLYVGESKPIEVEDVRTVVGMSKEYNIFELQRAIGSKNASRAVSVLERMLDQGEVPVKIAAALTRYFAALWKLSDAKQRGFTEAEQMRALKIYWSYFQEYEQAVRLHSRSEIESSFDLLAAADFSLKNSGDARVILNALVIQLVTGKNPELSQVR